MDKPLHVCVAEALGWIDTRPYPVPSDAEMWLGAGQGCTNPVIRIPRYDTDWSVAGPLIERYGIEVGPTYEGPDALPPWTAAVGAREDSEGDYFARGETPLIAICYLILVLRDFGKLAA